MFGSSWALGSQILSLESEKKREIEADWKHKTTLDFNMWLDIQRNNYEKLFVFRLAGIFSLSLTREIVVVTSN